MIHLTDGGIFGEGCGKGACSREEIPIQEGMHKV